NSRIKIVPSAKFIMPGLILSSLISVTLVGIATIIVVMFVSHRIAGPLYKLESLLERMAGGDVGFDICLRRKDEVKKLAEAFAGAVHGLNGLLCDVKKESARLGLAIKELKVLSERGHEIAGDSKKAIEKLEAAKSNLDDKLNKFRLRQDEKK
ncbi:MAG: methyl-accepting chemotaxis protein, partial [Candidatus Omnitrophota bacterium]|nr:methyl-accepting chemotaxis protein [Candidatus Omnitrophota bacterium]